MFWKTNIQWKESKNRINQKAFIEIKIRVFGNLKQHDHCIFEKI